MTKLTSDALVVAQGLLVESATQQHDLGTRVSTPDGRAFRYAKAGEALVAGTLLQAPVEKTNHQDLTPSIAAIGATSITVTLGATAATANYYAEGWALVTVTPGVGYMYKIKSHPAADSSGSLTITLEDPLKIAITATSRIDLVVNPYSGVIINPTTATSCPIGAATYVMTSAYYGWIQTHGPAVLLKDGGSTVGTNVSASNGTAGAVEAAVTAQAAIGFAMTGIATTEYGAVYLTLD